MNKHFVKIINLCIIIALVSASLMGCSSKKETPKEVATKPEFVLKFGHIANEENTWHKGALKFAEVVKEKSKGRILVEIYPNNQLGSEMDVIQSIQTGTADMTITADSLQNWAPVIGVMSAAYAIRDSEHMKKVVNGEVGKEIEKAIVDKTGLHPITWFERGPRNLTSNRPIKTPADLKGIIIRVPNVPVYVKTWDALGAKPTPMAFAEVFTSLQQGTIEGQENPLALIKSAGLFEVQKYCNLTEHIRGWIYVVIGEKKFQSMPKDLQTVILDAATEMQKYEHELFVAEEDQIAKELQAKGMTFVKVDKEAFEAKAKEAVISSLKPEQKSAYEKIINTK